MHKVIAYKKISSLLITCLVTLLTVTGQNLTGIEGLISSRFEQYCTSVPREEIYVHTDRDDYVAGETIWFSMYLIDRRSNMPSGMSDIAYFELLSHDNKPVIRRRIKIDNSCGTGGISIPDTLTSDIYYLRAYTNWMKNFLPYGCFFKEININSALYPGNTRDRSDMKKNISEKLGKIVDHTALNPAVSIESEREDNGRINLLIKANTDFVQQNSDGCYLFIHTHGIRNLLQKVILSGKVTNFSVDGNILIPGINHITLFNSSAVAVAERFIYTPGMAELTVDINSNDSIAPRKSHSVGLNTLPGIPVADRTINFSISVCAVSDFAPFEDLAEYMILGSEFEPVPGELKYCRLDSLSPGDQDRLLSSLKSNWINWNTIMTGKIPEFRYQPEKGTHFIYGSLVNSSTLRPDTGQYVFLSIPGKKAFFQYARSDSEGRFRFNIPVSNKRKNIIIQPEFIDKNNKVLIESPFSDVYIQGEDSGISIVKEIPSFVSRMSANYQVESIYGIDNYSVNDILDDKGVTPYRFYGTPDIEIIMDDYIKLPVMEEVFFELIPGTFLRNRRNGYELTVSDIVDNLVYEYPPMIMLDGVIIRDASVIANLDPEIVERIDVVRSRYLVGNYLIYGLVNVITRTGDFSSVTIPDYAVRLNYRAYDPILTPVFPDYAAGDSDSRRIPDFRNTLYWNPSVKPDKKGRCSINFWSSDLAADYIINIMGITGDGRYISCKKTLKLY